MVDSCGAALTNYRVVMGRNFSDARHEGRRVSRATELSSDLWDGRPRDVPGDAYGDATHALLRFPRGWPATPLYRPGWLSPALRRLPSGFGRHLWPAGA